MIDAIKTTIALCVNSRQVGQVTFWVNSMYDSLMYSATPAIFVSYYARAQGFEP